MKQTEREHAYNFFLQIRKLRFKELWEIIYFTLTNLIHNATRCVSVHISRPLMDTDGEEGFHHLVGLAWSHSIMSGTTEPATLLLRNCTKKCQNVTWDEKSK